jgi:hypothetical protein
MEISLGLKWLLLEQGTAKSVALTLRSLGLWQTRERSPVHRGSCCKAWPAA